MPGFDETGFFPLWAATARKVAKGEIIGLPYRRLEGNAALPTCLSVHSRFRSS